MKKIDFREVRVPEAPSTRRGDCVPGCRGTVLHAADDDKEPGSARTRRAPEAEMGTPVLVGEGEGMRATNDAN